MSDRTGHKSGAQTPSGECRHEHEDCNGNQWVCLKPRGHTPGHLWTPVQNDLCCKARGNELGHATPKRFGRFRCVRYLGHPGRHMF